MTTTAIAAKESTDSKLDCYNQTEWKEFIDNLEPDFYRRKRKPNLTELACSECDLHYQRLMIKTGRCRPVNWAVTPLARAFREEEDDIPRILVPLTHD